MVLRQKVFLGLVLIVNATLWVVPSNVVELVARDKHVLLGRYSREHFAWIVAVLVISLIGLYIDRAPPHRYRRRWFQVLATLLFAIPAVLALDFLSRRPEDAHYVRDSPAYHRPAGRRFRLTYEDRPAAARTLPNAGPGYPTVSCVYTADERGFRNRRRLERCDVVVLGDSFAEGANVSDEHAWPGRLGEHLGLSVCNLGMSGYGPAHYLAALEEYGLALQPRWVVCMIYEGNDFRADGDDAELAGATAGGFKRYVKQSPLLGALDGLMLRTFGPIGCEREVAGLEILSWLPVAIPQGPGARHYAFAPKQLLENPFNEKLFRTGRSWEAVAGILAKTEERCRIAAATLVITVAPTKAHVILPLVRERLPADDVQAFAALRVGELPEPGEFMEQVFANLPARERVVATWCADRGIPYVRVTESLRNATAAGWQTYYSYDQHWTPLGHEVLATTLADAWKEFGEKSEPGG